MKQILPLTLLLLALAAPLALAQETHDLADSPNNNGMHPWAKMELNRSGTAPETNICKDYLTCQIKAVSKDSFSNGDIWTREAMCSNCQGQRFKGPMRGFVKYYEIMQIDEDKGLYRFTLKLKPGYQ